MSYAKGYEAGTADARLGRDYIIPGHLLHTPWADGYEAGYADHVTGVH